MNARTITVVSTEQQNQLRDSMRSFFSSAYSFDRRQRLLAEPTGSAGVWRALADQLGILAAPFDEEVGGFGWSSAESLVIMEEIGHHLVLEPYLPTVILAGGLLKRSRSRLAGDLIREIISGRLRMCLAYLEPNARYNWRKVETTAVLAASGYKIDGRKSVVVGGPTADKMIVTARLRKPSSVGEEVGLFVVDGSSNRISRRDYRLIDGRPASEVTLDGVWVPEDALISDGAVVETIETVLDEGTVAVCAEATALMRRMVNDTADYLKQRKQFGVQLSQFQALRHRMVEMLVSVEEAGAITAIAASSLQCDRAERIRAVSAAKALVGRACQFVARNAVQLHGAIGVTDEIPVAHCFKRATVFETEFGSTEFHLDRYEGTFGATERERPFAREPKLNGNPTEELS